MTRPEARFPRRVYREGTEPDPRFSLANERTFLAWLRTALALFAAGVALEALELPILPPLRLGAAAVLVALGLLAAGQAWFGWMRSERALRRQTPLPGPSLGLILVTGIVVAVALVIVGLAL